MARIVRIVRNVEFAQLFDAFFISAISTILIIRFYLKLAGYPQIGSSFLHISHLLPGVLMMLAATLVLLATINRGARGFSAVLAGIGFGFAWDELGKFITKDNDYFFRATPGLIYLTFVIMYLIVRYTAQRRLTENDYLANVIDLLKDAVINDLDVREYEHAKDLLSHVSPGHPLYAQTKAMLESVKPSPLRQPSLLDKLFYAIKRPLIKLSRQGFFPRLVVSVAIVYGFISLLEAILFFIGASFNDSHSVNSFLAGDESDVVGGVAALASAFFTTLGVNRYFKGFTTKAYRLFELGLLVNIFIGQIILFFKNPDAAVVWLGITLFLLVNLEMLSSDRRIAHNQDHPQ
jgi:hypothetical protein